jgi:tetratricopeptide (TPR) repeat protein
MRLVYAVFILLSVLMTSAQCQQTAEDWFDKGLALGIQGKYDEAVQAFDKSIEINPQKENAWYNKGNAFKALGRITESNAAFAKAKELGMRANPSSEQCM